jgi:hypothetical protein
MMEKMSQKYHLNKIFNEFSELFQEIGAHEPKLSLLSYDLSKITKLIPY